MLEFFQCDGFYGSEKQDCIVYVCITDSGIVWYCVDGSLNVNAAINTDINFNLDLNVEDLEDVDTFTASGSIDSLTQFKREMIEHLDNN